MNVRRIDDEPRCFPACVVGQIPELGALEENLIVGFRNPIADRSRQQDAADDGADIDVRVRHLSDLRDKIVEPLRDTVLEIEIFPRQGESAGRNGPAGHARYSRPSWEQADFVKSPECANMKDHCSIAAARQGEGNTIFRRGRKIVLGFGQFRWQVIVPAILAAQR